MSILVLDRVNYFPLEEVTLPARSKERAGACAACPFRRLVDPGKLARTAEKNIAPAPGMGQAFGETYFGAAGVPRSPPLDEFVIDLPVLLLAGALDPWPVLGFPNSASKVSGSRVAVRSRPLSF